MKEPIIEAIDFSYRYPRTSDFVIKNINLSIYPGEFIGIVGPTGAGKTTLSLALSGLIPQVLGGRTEGELLIGGKNSKDTELSELLFALENNKEGVTGITFQDPEAQLVGMSVEEDLALGPENLGMPIAEMKERVDEVLRLIRMEDFRLTFPYTLSGGQKQRVAIGSIMTMRPKVLILDEPAGELDPIGRDEVFSVIRDLKTRANLSIIVVEHHTEKLARFCDRIIVLNEGEIIMDDRVEKVFNEVELLRSVGVRPPQGVELIYELKKAGSIDTSRDLLNEEEVVGFLGGLLKG